MMFDKRWVRMAAIMGNAVVTKCLLIVGGWYFGTKLDKIYGTEPYFMMGLIVLAMVVGISWLIWLANHFKF